MLSIESRPDSYGTSKSEQKKEEDVKDGFMSVPEDEELPFE